MGLLVKQMESLQEYAGSWCVWTAFAIPFCLASVQARTESNLRPDHKPPVSVSHITHSKLLGCLMDSYINEDE